VAAAALPDVLVRDPNPAIAARLRGHPLDQLAVALLDVDASGQLTSRLLKAGRQRVADRLEVAHAQHSGPACRGNSELDPAARERRREELAELLLELADLTSQVLAGEPIRVLGDPGSAAGRRRDRGSRVGL
jgi:hypothetical protein